MSWISGDGGYVLGFFLFTFVVFFVTQFIKLGSAADEVILDREKTKRPFSLTDLEGPIKRLLRFGTNAAAVVVSFSIADCKLRLTKYVNDNGNYGIVLLVPNTESSSVFFTDLRDYCQRNNVPFIIDEKSQSMSPQYIRVDCQHDVDQAIRVLKATVAQITDDSDSAHYEYVETGGSRYDGLANSGQQKPNTFKEFVAQRNLIHQKSTGVTIQGTIIYVILFLAGVTGYMALSYSIVLDVIVRISSFDLMLAVIPIEIFEISLRAKMFDLVAIVLVLMGLSAIWTPGFWVARLRRGREDDWRRLGGADWRIVIGRTRFTKALARLIISPANVLVVLIFLSWIEF